MENAQNQGVAPKNYNQQKTDVPPLLSKGWLRQYYGIPNSSGASIRLRTCVLTDAVLEEVGISQEEYHRRRYFTAEQSMKIKEILKLC